MAHMHDTGDSDMTLTPVLSACLGTRHCCRPRRATSKRIIATSMSVSSFCRNRCRFLPESLPEMLPDFYLPFLPLF